MRSTMHSTFATLLLLIPVASIPALAIFGIPQFAPVVSSPLDEGHEPDREHRVGDSARPPVDDLFTDTDDFPPRGEDVAPPGGRLGDSVPLPNRHAARGTSPREHDPDNQVTKAPGRLPSWAEEDNLDNRREEAPARMAFDPERPPGNNRFTPASFEQQEAPVSRPSAGGEVRVAAGEGFDPMASVAYQRQRDTGLERGTAPRREVATPRSDSTRESLTWQGAVRRLNELEIRNIRLSPGRDAGQFVFICSYTPPESPRVSYRFEAEADEPLKAVEKVLAQIDEWQQRQ